MKAPMSWLKKYVDIEAVTVEEIAALLTERGLEVAGIEVLGDDIQNVVVGQVLSMKKHENSDHLWVCQIDVGAEAPLQIVTGAQNLHEGDRIPVALHGAKLPGGIAIKKGKLRGEVSEGMLCSGAELQLKEGDEAGAEVDGIMILQEEFPLGQNIKDALALSDIVIEVEPTANRADWNCIQGVAREIAAAIGKPFHREKITLKEEGSKNAKDIAKVRVDAPELCPRYMARTASDIVIEPSPVWMRRALRAAGMRPINNVVDITNYVMIETGQPMHAFDFAAVDEQQIIVRTSQAGEAMTALNKERYELPANTLLIADPHKAVGIAGVMGGENSEITDATQTVLFESAVFNGANIRRSSKAMGLASDAASHFIKGVDIETTDYALERACSLMEEVGAGKIDQGVIDVVDSQALARKHFTARPEKISALLGKEIPATEMLEILQALEIPCQLKDGLLAIEVPHFRDDLEGEADIAEEVARVIGHNSIEPTLMRGNLMRGRLTERQKWNDHLRDILTGRSCFEAVTYSFTGPGSYDAINLTADSPLRQSVRLQNPFGEDSSLMRSTLLTGLIPVVALNAKRTNRMFRVFEIGNVHSLPESKDELPIEEQKLCLGTYGQMENFYTLKGLIIETFQALGLDKDALDFTAGGEDCFHPGRKALISLSGTVVGQMGELHPDVAKRFDIPRRAYFAELNLTPLFEARNANPIYHPISRFPEVNRDLAFLVNKEVLSSDLAVAMKAAAGALLESVELFDVYDGNNLPDGSKSLAYSLHFLSEDHTLTDDEVNERIDKILLELQEKYGASLRK